MLDVNVHIVNELRCFLSLVAADRALLQKFSISDSDFTRSRKLSFERLVLFIVRLCKRSLSIELEDFFAELGIGRPCSVSALTQQRGKLHFSFFFWWNTVLCQSYYRYFGDSVKRWGRYRLMAVDGSSVNLVNNRALASHFGQQRNQQFSYVTAQGFYLYDILNGLVLLPRLKPVSCGEVSMAYETVDCIEEDMLVIYDRGYCCYKLMALHMWQERERKFVIRARENHLYVREFVRSGEPSAVVCVPPTPAAVRGLKKSGFIINAATVLKVRLVRVDLGGQVEVLATNLWEEEGHSAGIFKGLYSMRWGIETNISAQKNIMQIEAFSGLTANSVMQDFHATILMANIHSVMLKKAQCSVDGAPKKYKHPMKINNNKSFGKLRRCITGLLSGAKETIAAIIWAMHDYFERNLLPVRKGRSFKRVKKRQGSSGKFITYTNFKPAI